MRPLPASPAPRRAARLARAALAAALMLALGACATTAPRAPALVQAPAAWSSAADADAIVVEGRLRLDWWTALGDPALDAEVAAALAANRDLAAADANLRAARLLAGAADAARAPGGAIEAGVRETRAAGLAQPPIPGTPERFPTQRLQEAGLGLRWELDLAGGLAAAADAADADATEALWRRRQAEAAIAAAVVDAWLERDDARRAGALAERQAALLDGVAGRLRQAAALGAAREDEASSAASAAHQARARALGEALRMRDAGRRLAVLRGEAPPPREDAIAGADAPLDAAVVPTTLGIHDPEATLRARPDVGAAEARVRAALARHGVARAALFPQVSLIGSVGVAAAPGRLGEDGALQFSAGPRLAWALFDLPRLRREAGAAAAGADAELARFEGVVLAALEEADGAVDGWGAAHAALLQAEASLEAERRVAAVVAARAEAGIASALDRARAEAALAEAERAALEARVGARRAWARACLALGAGWRDVPAG